MTATPAGMTYADYLKLDELLSAQRPLSDLHDEMLFIVIHQTKELWLKQMLHEVALAIALVRPDQFAAAYKALSRVSRIQSVMTLIVGCAGDPDPGRLHRLPPCARHLIGFPVGAVPRARIRLGIKDPQFLEYHEGGSEGACAADGGARRTQPSRGSRRRAGARRLRPRRPSEGARGSWLAVYRDADRWFDLYQLAEKLVDIDDALAAWRHKHVLTVERIIGMKRGTGGSAGAAYLARP